MDIIFVLGLAVMAAAVTVAARTGTFAPYLPNVNRKENPRTFWPMVLTVGAVVAVYLLIALWVIVERLVELSR